jgi:hypothetical protein
LQSIMPTPVVSRRSLTIAAVIVAIVEPFACRGACEPAGADQSRYAAGTIIE